jgi:glycosyltransferase involved in cell wall biosynthesis
MPDPDYASCCVLSFNRPRFLETALTTLVENAGHPLELIVHDDGSSAEERRDIFALCDGLMEEGKLSSLILNPPGHNQGQGVALNRMFGMATGDPILKLDHDLIFKPGWLARADRILRDNMVLNDQCAAEGLEPPEPMIGLLGLFHYRYEPVDSRKTILTSYPDWQEHTHICGSAFAMPREAWEHFGPFEEHSDAFAEDYVMQLRVTESEEYVCALPHEDLMENQGFGYGRSTLALAPDKVQSIHKQPVIIGRQEVADAAR